MEKISENPTVMNWHKIWIVKVSNVGEEFAKWLDGQTRPLVSEDKNPSDWAYYSDYSRFVNKEPIID
jgi:hypothetical protein